MVSCQNSSSLLNLYERKDIFLEQRFCKSDQYFIVARQKKWPYHIFIVIYENEIAYLGTEGGTRGMYPPPLGSPTTLVLRERLRDRHEWNEHGSLARQVPGQVRPLLRHCIM